MPRGDYLTKLLDGNKIRKVLQDHERRLRLLERALVHPKNKKMGGRKPSLSKHILGLRDTGFFSKPKTVDEVYKKLQHGYPCELNRVAVALSRLVERKQLRKASVKNGEGKKYLAYVW